MEIKRIREACENGDLEYIKKYKKYLMRRDDDGLYPIHHAILTKQLNIVEFLYNKQKICKTSKGLTCLMLAIKSCNKQMIIMFLDQIHIVDKKKKGIIYYILDTNNLEVFRYMIKFINIQELPPGNQLIDYCIKNYSYRILEALIEYLNSYNLRYDITFLERISDMVMIIEKKIRKNVIKSYEVLDFSEIYKDGKEDQEIEKLGKIIKYHSIVGKIPRELSLESIKYYKEFLYFGKISEFEIQEENEWINNAIEILNITKSFTFINYLMTIISYKRYFNLDLFHILIMNDNLSNIYYKILIKKGINSMKYYDKFMPLDILRILHLVNIKPMYDEKNTN